MLPPLSSIGSLPSVSQLTLDPANKLAPIKATSPKLFQSTIQEVEGSQHSADAAMKVS